MAHQTILGIDPGIKEMGTAVIRGRELLHGGVHTLRNGHRPYDVVGQARRVLLGLLADYAPQIVAIEAPLLLPTKRAALLSVIAEELHARAKEVGCVVVEFDPRSARRLVARNEYATKLEVARVLVRSTFPILRRSYRPRRRGPRSATPRRTATGCTYSMRWPSP